MISVSEEILMHYGVKRRSGRYPWGSGDTPYQHSGDFYSRVNELKKQGMSEIDIAKAVGLDSTTELRDAYKVAKNERRALRVATAEGLREKGYSDSEIAREMGINESSVRELFNPKSKERMNQARTTADILKKELETKKMIDVGAGVERELGVSEVKLKEALYMLESEGYKLHGVGVPQVTNPGQQTIFKVLCKNDVDYAYAYNHTDEIESVKDYYSPDGGSNFIKLEYPASISSDRVHIRYGDEGGTNKDGVIEIRRGVKDLDLGNSHYAQVRIMVDGSHYLKGMAMYSDDIPDGTDIVFNTNKKTGTAKEKVLKEIKDDPDNPFGASIKANGQSYYDDPNGKYTDPMTGKKQSLSAINKLKEEGDWDAMSKNLSSQFLSKQPLELIKKQLNLTYDDSAAQYDEICSVNNPTVKRKMLMDFADECDSAAVHLKAAALPRQSTQVILPLDKIKDTEIYAPNYKNGEKVVLIRYPHAGTFEIPELTVNNKNPAARKILGDNLRDAVGINSKVAEQLSGADFDGDQVVVIPQSSKTRIQTKPYLRDLKDFDAKDKYSTEGKEGVRLMKKSEVQKEMGMISNLITDMTLKGAPDKDLAKAVKHSMVVIDAHKHKLDYKQSEIDNDIATLKARWQVRVDDDGNVKTGGAATLISRKKQDVRVPERQGGPHIDPETGKVTYKESGRTYIDKNGNVVQAQTKVKLMSITDDAHTLSSGHPKESAYADYANKMKALGNQARKEALATGKLKYSPSANKIYEEEVKSLNSKLNLAALNAPRERRANAIANSVVKAKIQENPDMDKKEIKKASQIAINNARASVGASGKNSRITITDREWEAIQAGAISDSKLSDILRYSDSKEIKVRATPKATTSLSTAQINKIKAMAASGYTNAQIAESMGKSASVVSKYINS